MEAREIALPPAPPLGVSHCREDWDLACRVPPRHWLCLEEEILLATSEGLF